MYIINYLVENKNETRVRNTFDETLNIKSLYYMGEKYSK